MSTPSAEASLPHSRNERPTKQATKSMGAKMSHYRHATSYPLARSPTSPAATMTMGSGIFRA